MTEAAIPVTRSASPPRVWDTRDVAPGEAFDYYREGICACFMPLRPELAAGARQGFRSVLYSHAMPAGALNLVRARSHNVLRTRAEIAGSAVSGVYVNLQLDGLCRIEQKGVALTLHPGEVGIFDADTPFALDHGRRPGLRVASLLVPRSRLAREVPSRPLRLSDHPVYGRLVAEAAQALTLTAEQGRDTAPLHALVVSLIELCAAGQEAGPGALAESRPEAQRARIHAMIRQNAAKPGWTLADCAAGLGLSTRQVQRLLAEHDDGFASALTRERLALAAALLRDPAHRHRPVADIALMAGYSDPAPFSRAFREAYGRPPGQWREEHR